MRASQMPNILIFLVDQFPAAYAEPESACICPNIQRLAQEGVRFSQTYGPSPHCCPARATFMTGLYPSRHGVWNNVGSVTCHSRGLKPGTRSFSQELALAGYNLAYAGKWHVSAEQTPKDFGWQELTPASVKEPVSLIQRFLAQTAGKDESGKTQRCAIKRPGWQDAQVTGNHAAGPEGYKHNPYYRTAIQPALQAIPELAGQGKPWALCVSTDMTPAAGAPQDLLDLYDPSKIDLPASFGDTLQDKPRVYQRMRNQIWGQLSTSEVRESIANYMALCSMQDRMLGDLLDALEKTGQAGNTLALFVGDHGDHQFAHGLLEMGIHAFKESYHVPAIMRWPKGIVNPGRMVDDLVSLADFAPTFIELCGRQSTERPTGRSLVRFIKNEPVEDWRDAIFHQTNGNEVYFIQRTVRTKTWRYTYNPFDFDELYDLESDPNEMKNLAFPDFTLQPPVYAETREESRIWPHLPDDLDAVRREMMAKLWQFALEENDEHLFSSYPPVCLATYGPGQ